MNEVNMLALQTNLENIAKEYLFNISSLSNHNYFDKRRNTNNWSSQHQDTGFSILLPKSKNSYVVEKEMFLEGCTRIFLINPIFRMLMEIHDIKNDWKFGDTFGNYSVSNREYELENYLEFIAILDGKNVGIRYTKASHSHKEIWVIDRDFQYLYKKKRIPGFDKLEKVDELYVLDWSGASEHKTKRDYSGVFAENKIKEISIKDFFLKYFSENEYKLVLSCTKSAVKKAQDIIALNVVPQLLPNNMLNFKQAILEEFSESYMDEIAYIFEKTSSKSKLQDFDYSVIKSSFFDDGYRNAIIGKSDFAKSFITSEYLFKTMKSGLSIDYTAVVVGYLKAVEQLLYVLYLSAFEGKSGMVYWDTCNYLQHFDANNPNYRKNPYDVPKKESKQEKYYHKKKKDSNAPEIGELTKFLRYYKKLWRVSEESKEYIFECLEDFRKSCRNSHFHKDNIDASQYSQVERIRNNTYVCLFYLLGGFIFLDTTTSKEDQLGIINYRFENFYQEIQQKRRRFFEVEFSKGIKSVICYVNNDLNVTYNEIGILEDAELTFVKINIIKENAILSEINTLLEDKKYVKENRVSITRDSMPYNIIAFLPKKQ